jgi:GDSL-like Lipase/Acylhydrolase family
MLRLCSRISIALAAVVALSLLIILNSGPSYASTTEDTALHYDSFGWSYQEVAYGGDPGFQRPSYNASSWPIGQAAFGTTDGTCPWNNASQVNTPWDPGTDMLLRHHLAIPAGAKNVNISGTVDNNAKVYINGVLIDDVQSGNCNVGAINASIPSSDLRSRNLLAIRATDLGSATFIDVQVTYDGPPPTQYVALGDSFSSGEGNPPYDPGTNTPTDRCHRSPKAYPHLLNARQPTVWALGSDDFVACSGSEIKNVVYGQAPKTHHNEGSQLVKLSQSTAAVTISIGGNDVDFQSVLADCIFGNLQGVTGSSDCKDKKFSNTNGMTLNDYEHELVAQLATDRLCTAQFCSGDIVPSLAHLYELIQSDAPNAAIYVLLYPHLFNDKPGPHRCDLYGVGKFHAFIGPTNMTFINQGTDQVDTMIISQVGIAQAAGSDVQYADPRLIYDNTPDGQGHGVCTAKPWINGLHVTHNGVGAKPAPESFHPNKPGQSAFADAIQLAAGA